MNFIIIIKQAIRFGVVFLYGSTGETIVEKSGHLNLGIPGIMCLGGVGGSMGAYWAYKALYHGAQTPHLGWVAAVVIFSAIAMALIFGGAGGLLYGLFTITMRCNQNVTGLTLTTFGAGVLGFWGTQMGDKEISFAPVSRLAFTKALFFFNGKVPDDWFSTIFLSHGVLVYLGILIAILVAIYIKFTRSGLAMRAVGENPAAADAAGINVIAHKYVSCVVGAAIAGIGGAFYLLDCTRGSLEYVIDAMGWLAVALVIFSLWRPGIGIFGSFIFGFLYILPQYIEGVALAEKELLKVIPYAATALVLIVISFFNKRETQPPAWLGLPYFREDR
ncbi:MAG: ABC transporter permease [Clostridia bacterium]|nr:ABC transporter permease [Clostridia bacterium]